MTQTQNTTQNTQEAQEDQKTRYNLEEYVRLPFQRLEGDPENETWVVKGLMQHGGTGGLSGMPKSGKSSISRSLLISVIKGEPFLGRETTKSDVLLVSFEDYGAAINEPLKALGWNPDSNSDATLRIIDRQCDDNFALLAQTLDAYPSIKLVVVDHLQKFTKVSDLNESKNIQPHITRLRDEARKRNIHILILCHLKKGDSADTFERISGSTAIRGEGDVNIAILCKGAQRHIQAEIRRGRPIPPSLLIADVVTVNDAEMPINFRLGDAVEALEENTRARSEAAKMREREAELISVLQNSDEGILQSDLLKLVKGKTSATLSSLKQMEQSGVISRSGKPLVVTLVTSDSGGLGGIALWKMGNLGTASHLSEAQ
jgi:hypothetical protein